MNSSEKTLLACLLMTPGFGYTCIVSYLSVALLRAVSSLMMGMPCVVTARRVMLVNDVNAVLQDTTDSQRFLVSAEGMQHVYIAQQLLFSPPLVA